MLSSDPLYPDLRKVGWSLEQLRRARKGDPVKVAIAQRLDAAEKALRQNAAGARERFEKARNDEGLNLQQKGSDTDREQFLAILGQACWRTGRP